jgi:hypothetical protein
MGKPQKHLYAYQLLIDSVYLYIVLIAPLMVFNVFFLVLRTYSLVCHVYEWVRPTGGLKKTIESSAFLSYRRARKQER